MKLLMNLLKSPMFLFGAVLFFITIFVGLFGPLIYHVDIVSRVGMPYMPPGKEHLLGTNHLGVDMMSLLIKGLGSSLYVGFMAGIIATTTGTLLGVYAGFKGGWQDDFITLITNLFLVIPQFVVLILISSSLSPRNINPRLRALRPLLDRLPLTLLQVLARQVNRCYAMPLWSMFGHSETVFMRQLAHAICDWPGVPNPDCPITAIHGDRDHLIPTPPPNAALIPGGGHLLALSHPEELARLLIPVTSTDKP